MDDGDDDDDDEDEDEDDGVGIGIIVCWWMGKEAVAAVAISLRCCYICDE